MDIAIDPFGGIGDQGVELNLRDRHGGFSLYG